MKVPAHVRTPEATGLIEMVESLSYARLSFTFAFARRHARSVVQDSRHVTCTDS
jgi:hypothetical protein